MGGLTMNGLGLRGWRVCMDNLIVLGILVILAILGGASLVKLILDVRDL